MTDPAPTRRRFSPTPGWLIFGLPVVEGLLWLSERYRWFWFNEKKGWTVLIGVAVLGGAMLLMLAWFVVSLVLGWRFQFSIRSLLFLTVAVALPFSWLGVEMKRAREQKEAVEEIRKVGGRVNYDWEVDANLLPLPNAQPPGSISLHKLLGDDYFTEIVLVFFDRTKVTDAGLEHIKALSQLRGLCLDVTGVTDAGLEHLGGFSKLEYLSLGGTKVTDAGLEYLRGFSKLEYLSLDGTKVSDASLGHIRGLSQLRHLSLDGTKVTDSGLEHIKGLPQLLYLWLVGSNVTDEGVKKLQRALPNCKIER